MKSCTMNPLVKRKGHQVTRVLVLLIIVPVGIWVPSAQAQDIQTRDTAGQSRVAISNGASDSITSQSSKDEENRIIDESHPRISRRQRETILNVMPFVFMGIAFLVGFISSRRLPDAFMAGIIGLVCGLALSFLLSYLFQWLA